MPPSPTKGRLVNKAQLSKILGRPVKTIDEWVRRGMPVVERGDRGTHWKIDSAAAVQWLIEQARGGQNGDAESATPPRLVLEQERARAEKERADKLGFENAISRRELVSVSDVINLWSKMIGAAKQQLRAVPLRARDTGAIPDLTPKQAGLLRNLIDEALAELSGTGVPDLDDDAGGDLGAMGEEREGVGSAA